MTAAQRLESILQTEKGAEALVKTLIDDYGVQDVVALLFPYMDDDELNRLIDATFVRLFSDKGGPPEQTRASGSALKTAASREPTMLECYGELHTLREWAEITGVAKETIRKRLLRGWSVQEALTIPVSRASTNTVTVMPFRQAVIVTT